MATSDTAAAARLVASLASLLALSCSHSEPAVASGPEIFAPSAHPDVLLITVDTLRHDFLSCYGFPRDTTPAIDALAAQGALFEEHRTVISLTLPAHVTIFSGLFPSEHGVRRNLSKVDRAVPLLAERFQSAGYRTAAVVGSSVLEGSRGLARGFETYDDEMPSDAKRVGAQREEFERDATAVLARALAVVRRDDPRPLFLWVHFYDAHEPYVAPERYVRSAGKSREVHEQAVEPSELFTPDQQVKMRTGYEAEVRFIDQSLAELIGGWDARPRGRSALVALTSDHGQGLGEHDYSGHGFRIYEEQLRVPLVLRMPGCIPRGLRITSQTSSIDLAATLADLAHLQDAPGFGGHSLADRLAGTAPGNLCSFAERREWTGEDVERVGEVRKLLTHLQGRPGATRGDQFAMIEGHMKYIWSADAPHEAFDLSNDPRETRNLLLQDSSTDLRARLETWHSGIHVRVAEHPEEKPDPKTLRALRALGY